MVVPFLTMSNMVPGSSVPSSLQLKNIPLLSDAGMAIGERSMFSICSLGVMNRCSSVVVDADSAYKFFAFMQVVTHNSSVKIRCFISCRLCFLFAKLQKRNDE